MTVETVNKKPSQLVRPKKSWIAKTTAPRDPGLGMDIAMTVPTDTREPAKLYTSIAQLTKTTKVTVPRNVIRLSNIPT